MFLNQLPAAVAGKSHGEWGGGHGHQHNLTGQSTGKTGQRKKVGVGGGTWRQFMAS